MKVSNQIYADFRRKEGEYNFSMTGRGTSVLGSVQGDHVTAYALVEHGIKTAVRGIQFDDESGAMIDPRTQRGNLYNFLNKIAALNPPKREELFTEIITVLQGYNNIRFKKTD
ncbi:MAG: hypothetical protein K0R73_741 [Candidatus Midichloriaceae bacterium]|jgi:hypothetical protein|nr:hypothetical protein [Candidatus Midichloriaceae bacterium]